MVLSQIESPLINGKRHSTDSCSSSSSLKDNSRISYKSEISPQKSNYKNACQQHYPEDSNSPNTQQKFLSNSDLSNDNFIPEENPKNVSNSKDLSPLHVIPKRSEKKKTLNRIRESKVNELAEIIQEPCKRAQKVQDMFKVGMGDNNRQVFMRGSDFGYASDDESQPPEEEEQQQEELSHVSSIQTSEESFSADDYSEFSVSEDSGDDDYISLQQRLVKLQSSMMTGMNFD